MAMFAGEYLCKVDEKGRFIVPSPIREQIEAEGQTVMFLKGPEQSLLIYSTREWEKVLERTRTSLDEDQSRLFMHFVVSEAGSSDIDKTGRILIPGRLRKLVPVDEDQEIILVGLYHRMEIWNPSEWRRYLARTENRFEQNMSKILNLL
jgi:MraZ protein